MIIYLNIGVGKSYFWVREWITGEMDTISPDEAVPPASPDPQPPDRRPPSPMLFSPIGSVATKRRMLEGNRGPIKKTIVDKESASASIQTVYTHPSLTILGIRSYESTDGGPFIVHVTRVEPDPAAGTTIRPIKFGQFLFINKIENICHDGVKKVGRNKISIQFKTALGANKFLDNPMLKTYKYEAFIPTYNVTKMGIVRGVPVDWSMEEFVDSLQMPGFCTQILKARRLNKKNMVDGNIVWEPSQTVVLTFRGQELPTRVFSYYSSLLVENYQFPTIQCMNCCRFGHIKTQCRSQPRCYRCAQPHSGDGCSISETESTCFYCSAHHFTTSKSCPEQDRQKLIKMTMSRDSISYHEASSQVPKVGKSFNQVVKDSTIPAPPPQVVPSPVRLSSTQSYRKTDIRSPRPRAPLTKSYDKVAHGAIIANEASTLPNGYALQMNQSATSLSQEEPQNQLLVQLLTIIISMISQHSINLPPNVALMIAQLSSFIEHNNYGPVSNPTVELQKSSSEDS